MTGRRAGSEELQRWGVVNSVVPAEHLLDAALELANRVAACAPLSLQAIKEIDRATDGLGDREAFKRMRAGDLSAYGRVYDSDDAVEGIASVSEKRDPVWKGR